MHCALLLLTICLFQYLTIASCAYVESTDEDSKTENEPDKKQVLKNDNGTSVESDNGSEKDNENVSDDIDKPNTNPNLTPLNSKPEQTHDPQYAAEMQAGDLADLFATNRHHSYPDVYKDFSRRFVLQYPYVEKNSGKDQDAEEQFDEAVQIFKKTVEEDNEKLTPVKTSPDFVLAVAKQSAAIEAQQPHDTGNEVLQKKILRSGDYWNAVWKENIDPKSILRSQNMLKKTQNVPSLETVRVKILPGSKLYKLVSLLKKMSPRLMYVINNKNI